MSLVQAIRGEIPVEANTPAAVQAATARLCAELLSRNRLQPEAVIAARFRLTPDLAADPVIESARQAGWEGIPIFAETLGGGALGLSVEAHVRLRKKRRLKAVELAEPGPENDGSTA